MMLNILCSNANVYLIDYSDNYSKTSRILFQYCRDVPAVDGDGEVTDFTEANATDSFNLKVKLIGQASNNGTKNIEIMVPLSNFWKTLEMPLINFKTTLDLNWSGNCIIVTTNVANQATNFQ